MSGIDMLRAARPALLDIVSPQRVVFHHVPKCGGTSVGRALRKRYILSQASVTPEESFRAFADYSGMNDEDDMLVDVIALRTQMMLYEMHRDTRCISLHVPFSRAAHARFYPKYKFVTLLRDPVERFISHYNWATRPDAGHAKIALPMEDFLETKRARRMGATYVEYFCGAPEAEDLSNRHLIDSAVRTLHDFDVIGKLKDLENFRLRLTQACGIKLKIRHENRSRTAPPLISERTHARIRALCAPDIAVWERLDA